MKALSFVAIALAAILLGLSVIAMSWNPPHSNAPPCPHFSEAEGMCLNR